MPSPFPGMDPYIEGQRWQDFHTRFIGHLGDALVPYVRPRYVALVEERVYVGLDPMDERDEFFRPDVTVVERESSTPPHVGGMAVAVAIEPIILTLPRLEQQQEHFLTLRDRETGEVVTVIEFLSPSNKRRSSNGRSEYLNKREAVLQSAAHLVELDLLRGGERLPTVEPLPPADYYAFVSRADRRRKVEVYRWMLRQPLPTIPIPLAGDDPDVPLELQAVFTTVYDRAGYDYSLAYHHPVEPPLSEPDAEWAQKLVKEGR